MCRVRVVKPTDSKIYAAVGNGTCGKNGDGSAGGAASQQLNHAQHIANDPSNTNRIWIADTSNHQIRRIDCASNCTAANTTPTYTLTTVIGSGASGDGDGGVIGGAVLNAPFGVYVNASGNIFVADSTNNKIKEAPAANGTNYNIAMTTGKIYTIAGSGSTTNNGEGYPEKLSGLNNPYSVAVYGGTVYMTDTGHHMIRKISANYNLIAAAGIGTSGTAGNGTLPYSSAVLEPQRHRRRQFGQRLHRGSERQPGPQVVRRHVRGRDDRGYRRFGVGRRRQCSHSRQPEWSGRCRGRQLGQRVHRRHDKLQDP